MSEAVKDWAALLIEGRKRRIEHLFTIIANQPGLESDFYEGKFARPYPVKQSTFLGYLSSLVKQGRVIRMLEGSETVPRYWTQQSWTEEMEVRAMKDRERVRSLSGKIDEYPEIETSKK